MKMGANESRPRVDVSSSLSSSLPSVEAAALNDDVYGDKDNITVVSPMRVSTARHSLAHSTSDVDLGSLGYLFEEPEIQKLVSIPLVEPLLRNSSSTGIFSNSNVDMSSELDPQPLITVCNELKLFLHLSAEAAEENQRKISAGISKVQQLAASNASSVSLRHRQYIQYRDQFQEIKAIGVSVYRVDSLARSLMDSLTQMNMLLPPDLRLETFSWRPPIITDESFLLAKASGSSVR